ncbi:hypothetical protein MSAN_02499000 [Mycena sanguinolenta]|uniref:Uncharacterized protein n=1 Tax=Mycena sanguinolenta TaxID=230812 RepID=A0A8H6TWM3_9AGAR|nr:hypothetical protein MSAN_02499000 [Mycena sanguinolenta]
MQSSVGTYESESVFSADSAFSKTRWPEDWTMWTNFNGTIYYTSDGGKLITTDDVRDDTIRELVLELYDTAIEWFEEIDAADPEVVLYNADEALRLGERTATWRLASWSRGETYTVDDAGEIVAQRNSSFWNHVFSYPMHRTSFPPRREAEFVDAVAFLLNDRTCDGKAQDIPFEEAKLKRIWQIYQDLKALNTPAGPSNLVPALAYHMGQIMDFLVDARQRNNYGLTEVAPRFQQLYPDEASSASPWELAIWDPFLTVILCGTHENYRARLDAAMPRRTIRILKFRNLMRSLLSEWADSNLVATVTLSVNVAFLGIPGLTALPRSASIVSALFALTSIITGLHHVWQHREKTDAEHEDVKEYLFFFKLFTEHGPEKSPPTTLDLTPYGCTPCRPTGLIAVGCD